MTKFILVRHATPNYTKILNMKMNKYYATSLAPLSKKGLNEANLLSNNPLLKDSDIIISSPFTRALETALILNTNDLELIIEPNLHEWLPDINHKYFNDNYDYIGPFESIKSINKRSLNVLKKYLNYNKVIVVSHKFVIYSLIKKDTKMGDFHEIEITNNKIKVLKK